MKQILTVAMIFMMSTLAYSAGADCPLHKANNRNLRFDSSTNNYREVASSQQAPRAYNQSNHNGVNSKN